MCFNFKLFSNAMEHFIAKEMTKKAVIDPVNWDKRSHENESRPAMAELETATYI